MPVATVDGNALNSIDITKTGGAKYAAALAQQKETSVNSLKGKYAKNNGSNVLRKKEFSRGQSFASLRDYSSDNEAEGPAVKHLLD